jgi:hypothetical protein
MKEAKKTSFSMSANTARILERNRLLPDRSARLNQIVARYDMLVANERQAVADLADNKFLDFVIAEWLEVYPIQLSLPWIVDMVYQERKLDGFDVPDEEEYKGVVENLKKLTLTQQVALVELIEARGA